MAARFSLPLARHELTLKPEFSCIKLMVVFDELTLKQEFSFIKLIVVSVFFN